jgi:hypothetical protein
MSTANLECDGCPVHLSSLKKKNNSNGQMTTKGERKRGEEKVKVNNGG